MMTGAVTRAKDDLQSAGGYDKKPPQLRERILPNQAIASTLIRTTFQFATRKADRILPAEPITFWFFVLAAAQAIRHSSKLEQMVPLSHCS